MIVQKSIELVVSDTPVKNDINSIRQLSIDLFNLKVALESSGQTSNLFNNDMLIRIQRRLPRYLQNDWVKYIGSVYMSDKTPNLNTMIQFIERVLKSRNNPFAIAAQIDFAGGSRRERSPSPSNRSDSPVSKPILKSKTSHVSFLTSEKGESSESEKPKQKQKSSLCCVKCGENHFLNHCGKFKALSVTERLAFVRSKELCENCLNKGHFAKSCSRDNFCRNGCIRKHHSLLHVNQNQSSEKVETSHLLVENERFSTWIFIEATKRKGMEAFQMQELRNVVKTGEKK